ncbi:membrane protein [Streptococcus criceti]|uniref:Membrane protein n=1 Tax=Streptococcus criceti HS-6 TaxID=873449 RepID=G5JPE0_STRCG|nr:AI-2E family transporter [Streptococcus criceti]EHI74954.1 putative membrane protein [Streptococcus criceti HS-6]SUN43468.1 membrane protein [Streptococcus criceti]
MKLTKRHFGYLFLVIALIYATVTYWSLGQRILLTIYRASLPFLAGAGMAYIINIVMSGYEHLLRKILGRDIPGRRAISLILSYLTFVIAIFLIFSIVLPDLITSLKALLAIDFEGLGKLFNHVQKDSNVQRLMHYFHIDLNKSASSLLNKYNKQISTTVIGILSGLLTSATSLASGLVSLFISFVFSIYVLAGKEKLGRQGNMLVHAYLPKYEEKFHYVRRITHESFHGFFVGQTLEAMILGSLCALGMLIFKIPYAGTVGILVGFTALIPVVGAYIGLSIGAILIMTLSIPKAIFFVVFLVILQQFEGNLIYPRVVGHSIGLPPMWVILVITIGASLWGILGMLVAVPTAATIYKLIRNHVYNKRAKEEQRSNQAL